FQILRHSFVSKYPAGESRNATGAQSPPAHLAALTSPGNRATPAPHTRNRAFRGRQTDEEDFMSQISLTFPDGNARDYPAGTTAAEVAASIAPSLAKNAISASLDGRHIDLQWPIT